MKPMVKKRLKGFLIDLAISTTVSAGIEYMLRKKVKNEVVHGVVTPTTVMWALEYIQLRQCGQTVGQKAMKIMVADKQGCNLSSKQIIKRMAYRDTLSTFDYLRNRHKFTGENGERFSHDRYARTEVKVIK